MAGARLALQSRAYIPGHAGPGRESAGRDGDADGDGQTGHPSAGRTIFDIVPQDLTEGAGLRQRSPPELYDLTINDHDYTVVRLEGFREAPWLQERLLAEGVGPGGELSVELRCRLPGAERWGACVPEEEGWGRAAAAVRVGGVLGEIGAAAIGWARDSALADALFLLLAYGLTRTDGLSLAQLLCLAEIAAGLPTPFDVDEVLGSASRRVDGPGGLLLLADAVSRALPWLEASGFARRRLVAIMRPAMRRALAADDTPEGFAELALALAAGSASAPASVRSPEPARGRAGAGPEGAGERTDGRWPEMLLAALGRSYGRLHRLPRAVMGSYAVLMGDAVVALALSTTLPLAVMVAPPARTAEGRTLARCLARALAPDAETADGLERELLDRARVMYASTAAADVARVSAAVEGCLGRWFRRTGRATDVEVTARPSSASVLASVSASVSVSPPAAVAAVAPVPPEEPAVYEALRWQRPSPSGEPTGAFAYIHNGALREVRRPFARWTRIRVALPPGIDRDAALREMGFPIERAASTFPTEADAFGAQLLVMDLDALAGEALRDSAFLDRLLLSCAGCNGERYIY